MATTTPTAKKLRIAPDDRFALFNAPPGYAAKVRPPAPGHRDIEATPGTAVKVANRANDAVLIFVRSTRDLRAARVAAKSVKADGLIWVAYPKGGALETDLNRDVLREALAKHGLESVSLVALDETWSAMRFKRSVKAR
jgi:hypothetical protein